MDELARVLPRLPRIGLTPVEVRDLVDSLMFLADIVEPEGADATELRETADQPVLLTLLAAQANYLITGDKDLLALADRYSIVTPAEFWARHGV
ncbi:PIN domain-containing protein [Pseudomonas sp. B392_1p]|uniref:PIN domain-containing protein n=1 Tax=Pseudomonas sp. B392_1p TaxID=3457507 RepID=UPI003FD3175E